MRPPELRITLDGLVVDCFAGGGGASTGIEMALGRSPDIAINHDPQAVAMHKLNHPNTRHYCENITELSPRKVTGGRHVALAWFSPDCTFHSKARGGKPFRDRNKARRTRGLAWVVVNWAREVRPDVIMLENVEEFAHWGPLGADGKPCPLRKGFTFRRWCAMLQNLGYTLDMRELRACDYGAPTTRKRLFVIARCDGKPIVWPEPTHAKGGAHGLLPYRTAAECIDFSLPCPSIFLTKEEGLKVGAKRPLAENTMKRIARGLKKFVLDNPKPFIVGLAHGEHRRGAGDRSHGLAKQSLVGKDGWIPICEKNLPFETTCYFLLLASAPGVPEPIKLQEQHRAMFPGGEKITEAAGRAVAAWAAGGRPKEPAPTQSSGPARADAAGNAESKPQAPAATGADPMAHELDALLIKAREWAECGAEKWKEFWLGLTDDQKRAIGVAKRDEFKAIAAQVPT